MLLAQQLSAAVQRASAQIAILAPKKALRFSELPKKVAQLSYLYQNELGQRARIAVLAHNCAAFPLTFIALSNTRATVIPIDPSRSREEIADWLRAADATHLLVSTNCASLAREILMQERISLPIIDMEKKMGGEYDSSFIPPPESPPTDRDIVLLLRTSGATEKPRLAAFDHTRLQGAVSAIRACYRLTSTDRFLTRLSWAHPFGFLHGMLFPLLGGAGCVVDPGYELKDMIPYLREMRVSRIAGSVVQCRELLSFCANGELKLPLVKSVTAGLEAVDEELRALAQTVGLPLLGCYGQTENLWTIAMDDASEKGQKPKALAGLKYKVLDANGDAIEGRKDRTGMLAVSGPTVMAGYRGIQEDEASEKAADKATKFRLRGTWLYTGDIARLSEDADGTQRVEVLGRKEQLLESCGSFFSPCAIDRALMQIPGAPDGAGFVTQDLQGKSLLACAIQSQQTMVVRPQEIHARLMSLLTGGGAPAAVVVADSIPRGLAGVDRCKLSRQFSGISATEPAFTGPEAAVAVQPEPEKPVAPVPGPSSIPIAAPIVKQPAPVFVTCELDQVAPGVVLPVSLYLYLQFRFVPYVERGKSMDRDHFDRMQFKGISNLFLKLEEREMFLAWSKKHGQPAPEAPDPDDAIGPFRHQARARVLALFQSPRSPKQVEELLQVSNQMLDQVMEAPYAVRPLAQLQTLASGTIEHSLNVSLLSVYLALQMGYSHKLILQHISAGALLHDFGKALIQHESGEGPAQVAAKLKQHPALAVAALEKSDGVPKEVRMIIEQHHECHDGSGYPLKLRGGAIYDLARIVSIANIFDGLVSQGEGTLENRQISALRQLSEDYAGKIEPIKLKKALKILSLGLPEQFG